MQMSEAIYLRLAGSCAATDSCAGGGQGGKCKGKKVEVEVEEEEEEAAGTASKSN